MDTWEPVHADEGHGEEWQHEKFLEFVRYKQLVGEPSPHMTLAVHMSKDEDELERMWRVGVYATPYSVLTSEAIWREWPWLSAVRDPEGLRQWIHDNWAGFHVRTERRMVRTPGHFATSLLSWRQWMLEDMYALPKGVTMARDSRWLYDIWYGSILQNVHNYGRYITIRAVEAIRRSLGVPLELYDIRSIGGESPVRCLSLLYPAYKSALLVDKDMDAAEMLGEALLVEVRAELPQVSHYVLAAMLCEYREAYEDHHQYPARTIDQELEYLNGEKAAYWKDRKWKTSLWEVRKEVIANEALGELHGWSGVRHDLSRWLRDKGQNWTDTKYLYPEDA